jgi:nitrate/TMAO reductase-like tetraheme cytochrome c subunit
MRAWIHRLWIAFRTPSARWGAGTLVVLGLLAGAIGWGGFEAYVASTSTLQFCTSCHEMQAYVYQEYKQSPHYANPSGVRAICADCHVPHALAPKLWRKFQATTNEIPNHFRGSIDTKEKFEAHRQVMAEHVWATMKSNDSRECRGCHTRAAMVLERQKPRARAQHTDMLTTHETCIDCHKGIAHHLPRTAEDDKKKAPAEDDFSL